MAGLECFLNLVRALRMGSCISSESTSPVPSSPVQGVSKGKIPLSRLMDEQLRKISGRRFMNGSSEVASLYTRQGEKGTNQDAMIVWENFASRADTVFCGVFDGHGSSGHVIAKRVRDSLPLKISSNWEANMKSNEVLREITLNTTSSMNSENGSFVSADEEPTPFVDDVDKQPEIFTKLKESFLKAYKLMDKDLNIHPNVHTFFSGTTAVTLVKQGQYLVIGNVGDSRAVMGSRNKDGALVAVQLTVDLKPNVPAEAERIRKCKGRVFSLKEEPNVSRVWHPHFDTPGLAMARAFGDFCLKDYGLTSVPEITCLTTTDKDDFVVLATDGIWDVLSNEEVVKIIASAPVRSYAARTLVETAVRAWRYKYPTSRVDDCAVVCLFLDSTQNSVYTPANKGDVPFLTGVNHSRTARSENHIIEDIMEEEEEEEEMDIEESGVDWSVLGVSRVDTELYVPRNEKEK